MRRLSCYWLICGLAIAQNPPAKLAFEVASVRLCPPGIPMQVYQGGKVFINIDDARVSIGCLPLSSVIQIAFRIPPDQIMQPDWTEDLRIDVQGKLPQGATKDRVPDMLRTLLEERFKLVAHHDEKVFPVYALTVGKDGPKFHESTDEDPAAGGCKGGFQKVCRHVTMEDLARVMSQPVGMAEKHAEFANVPGALDRRVVDMTGLKGVYDFELVSGCAIGRGACGSGTNDPNVVSMFDAMKALGLKMEPAKHAYQIVVIDHIERVPTEN
jgi:uncharacterized protein (TIGR03435 family)